MTEITMTPTKVVLLACGSYNPPTNMHLRMFGYEYAYTSSLIPENARDYLQRVKSMEVVGGIMSPVHDAYQKKDLLPCKHRCNMVRLALRNSDWIRLSDWECSQPGWFRTVQVLQYHQNKLTSALSNHNDYPHKKQRHKDHDEVDDIPQSMWSESELVSQLDGDSSVQLLLLCGADLLESFAVPNLWNDEDIEMIVGHHGLVVITREGYNPYRFIHESDLLTKYETNIHVVTEWIANEVSSTKIRRAVRRGDSIKYLVPDAVENYIRNHRLFSTPGVEMDENVDDTDSSNCAQRSPRKAGRPNRQGIDLNEVNSKRSAPGGVTRNSREDVRKVSADALNDFPNGEEEAKVKIQITKDGIRVISDKETTV